MKAWPINSSVSESLRLEVSEKLFSCSVHISCIAVHCNLGITEPTITQGVGLEGSENGSVAWMSWSELAHRAARERW